MYIINFFYFYTYLSLQFFNLAPAIITLYVEFRIRFHLFLFFLILGETIEKKLPFFDFFLNGFLFFNGLFFFNKAQFSSSNDFSSSPNYIVINNSNLEGSEVIVSKNFLRIFRLENIFIRVFYFICDDLHIGHTIHQIILLILVVNGYLLYAISIQIFLYAMLYLDTYYVNFFKAHKVLLGPVDVGDFGSIKILAKGTEAVINKAGEFFKSHPNKFYKLSQGGLVVIALGLTVVCVKEGVKYAISNNERVMAEHDAKTNRDIAISSDQKEIEIAKIKRDVQLAKVDLEHRKLGLSSKPQFSSSEPIRSVDWKKGEIFTPSWPSKKN
jgi:hypothetical protein